jgi:hypothetical protein
MLTASMKVHPIAPAPALFGLTNEAGSLMKVPRVKPATANLDS